MKKIKPYFIYVILLLSTSFVVAQKSELPKHYICYTSNMDINVDGKLSEKIWQKTAWSDYFVDIEGSSKPVPRYKTRFKMLKDNAYIYFAAELEEPNVWATIKSRDAVIFHDNDFEIFIDPDGDTHQYFEFELNAFSTYWDLMLIKPYRNGGPAINAWDIKGVKVGVYVDGTINNPTDTDKSWTIEVAMPWSVFLEAVNKMHPPEDGEFWRMNFSRVEWQVVIENGKYKKAINPATNRVYPEDNWVWSPQGVIQMHRPETWGYIQFTDTIAGQAVVEPVYDTDKELKNKLFEIYYAMQKYKNENKQYTTDMKALNLEHNETAYMSKPHILATISQFEVIAKSENTGYYWHINHNGRLWKTIGEY